MFHDLQSNMKFLKFWDLWTTAITTSKRLSTANILRVVSSVILSCDLYHNSGSSCMIVRLMIIKFQIHVTNCIDLLVVKLPTFLAVSSFSGIILNNCSVFGIGVSKVNYNSVNSFYLMGYNYRSQLILYLCTYQKGSLI